MSHEAFALSPISARNAQLGELDYEAIREAFMETARGRWFLGEYAKRNRDADTCMVLEAVARLERALEDMQQPPPDARLPEILAILLNIVDQAAEAVASAVDRLAIEQRLAPIRKGARILENISWRWREIGAEPRTCDSIDSQVGAIQESCNQLAGMDIRAALTGAFELIRTGIEELAADDGKAVPLSADVVTRDHVESARSEPMVVAERVGAGSHAAPPWMRTEPPAAPLLQPHPSLGATPWTSEFLDRRPVTDVDPFSVIRRMSLTEKLEFFS
jgi:hypothetical protein